MTGRNTNRSKQSPFLTRGDLDWWASFYAAQTAAQEGVFQSWLIFRLGEERFAVPLDRLSEITRVERGVGLSHVASGILGLINNRGEAVLLADMGQILGIHRACSPSPEQRVLLFEDDNGLRTGFLVDRIEEVASLNAKGFQEYSPSQGDTRSRFIVAVGEYEGKGLARIDVGALLGTIH